MEVGHTFPLLDERTGRKFIGWGSSIDVAISDALRQLNEARASEIRIVSRLREFVDGGAP